MLNDATDLSQSIASTLYEEEYSSNQITPSLREFFLASSNNNEYVGTTGETIQQQRMISHDSTLSGSENTSSANSMNYPILSPMVLFQKGSSHPMNPLASPVGNTNNNNNHNNHFPIKNPSLQGTVTTESSTPHSTRGYSPPTVPH
jgi:hypothetical protein